MAADLQSRAQALIRNTQAHLTQPRVRVLALLLGARRELSHDEIMALLPHEAPVDRVTVYRVLDWLAAQGLARRSVGRDRVFRYGAVQASETRAARAEFKCNQCGITRRVRASAAKARLPRGFTPQYVETLIVGTCSDCAGTH
jgi:Fur family ferric uptake transcriptional regulator